jgi:F-type H+-transporting ATPase subunit b
MDQLLTTFGIEWRLLLLQMLNIGIVLVALRYFLYKPVFAMLAKRQALVAKGVQDAKDAEELLKGADATADAQIQKANEDAGKMVAHAREVATAEKARLLKESEERAASIASDAEARAKETLERARKESEKEVARLAVLAAEKIMSHKV